MLGGLALPVLANGFAAAAGPTPALLVVIAGIDPATSPALLASVTLPFVEAGLAVVLSVNPFLANGTALSPRDALSWSLREALDKFPARLEVAVDVREMPVESHYRQLRQASISQAALTKAINPAGNPYLQPLVMAATLTTRTAVGSLEDLSGLRAAGIRTVIHLPQPANDARAGEPWLLENVERSCQDICPRPDIFATLTGGNRRCRPIRKPIARTGYRDTFACRLCFPQQC